MRLVGTNLPKFEVDSTQDLAGRIERACDVMAEIYDAGYYFKLVVKRAWSKHNPIISGEFAKPSAFRAYLSRELRKLVEQGATFEVRPSRPVIPLDDPALLDGLDEDEWDFTQKKLFLFSPERIDLSLDRLQHYTGTRAEDFQRHILFTNYDMHVHEFERRYPECTGPKVEGVQMPAYHHKLPQNKGITLVNIGVGPSNAKTITDHLAVLRPDLMVMVGHCGGLRNHQEIGDFVLATGFMRADGVLDDILPLQVPITPNHLLNLCLQESLDHHKVNYRLGTVYTTVNRNWEFSQHKSVWEMHVSRSLAVDMESATVATNGFRYRIPNATLLCVSDKPLHGKPKLTDAAQTFYGNSKKQHLDIVIRAIERSKEQYPDGLPNASLRAPNEPLMGGADKAEDHRRFSE